MSKQKYKPVSFSTTLRNPLRVLSFLDVIANFRGQILTDTTILSVEKQLIKQNLYKPTLKPQSVLDKQAKSIDLSDEEVEIIIEKNPQTHKEAGFSKGWASRFATHYNMLMEFGLLVFAPNEEIIVTPKGEQLLSGDSDLISTLAHSIKHIRLGNKFKPGMKNRQQVYLTFVKAFRYKKELTQSQFYALACAKDSDDETIKFLLDNHSKSDIESHWESKFNVNAFERSKETVDDLSRKLSLTGVFTVSKSPNFSFGLKNTEDIEKMIAEVEGELSLPEQSYLEIMTSKITIFIETSKNISNNSFLEFWDKELSEKQCIDIFSKCNGKAPIKHDALSYVPRFVLFEMMTGLLLYKTNPGIKVNMHLHYDDNMIPTAAASGGTADIVCELNGIRTNVEVTLLTGVAQNSNESQSTLRHLIKGKADALLFIAPNISRDLAATYQFEIARRNLEIGVVNTEGFISIASNKTPKQIILESKNVLKNQSLVDEHLALRVNELF